MPIAHMHERLKLAELFKQESELWDEMEAALAPLEAAHKAKEKQATQEYIAAGGMPGPGTLEWLKDEKQQRLHRELWAKTEPERTAICAMRDTFEARRDAIRSAIKTVETGIEAEVLNDPLCAGRAYCALTGLLILSCDSVGLVLVDTLPVTAAARKNKNECAD